MKTLYYLKAPGFNDYKYISKGAFKKALAVCQKLGVQFHIYRSIHDGRPIKKLHLLPIQR